MQLQPPPMKSRVGSRRFSNLSLPFRRSCPLRSGSLFCGEASKLAPQVLLPRSASGSTGRSDTSPLMIQERCGSTLTDSQRKKSAESTPVMWSVPRRSGLLLMEDAATGLQASDRRSWRKCVAQRAPPKSDGSDRCGHTSSTGLPCIRALEHVTRVTRPFFVCGPLYESHLASCLFCDDKHVTTDPTIR